MAPLQRFHQLWSLNLFDDDDVYSETDDGFVDLQVATVPLQDHYSPQQSQHSLDTKHTSSNTTKKSVSFSLSNDICIIDNKKALSEEEKANIWYDKKDYYRFKDSCRRIIEWVASSQNQFSFFGSWDSNQEDNNDEETTKYCMRGLERHTRDGNAKYIQRITARGNDMYVLRMTGASTKEVATIMVQHSLPCVAEAQERARQDALAAFRYQHETSLSPTTTSTTRQPKLGPDTWASLLPTIRTIRDQYATAT